MSRGATDRHAIRCQDIEQTARPSTGANTKIQREPPLNSNTHDTIYITFGTP